MVGWRGVSIIGLLCIGLLVWQPQSVGAGALSGLRDYLLRQQENLNTGQVHQMFFVPATSIAGSGNTVVLSFPIEHSGEWCGTAGSDLTVVGLVDPQGATENATVLPGTLTAACTQGDNATFGDAVIVSGVGPVTSGTRYGFSVSDGSIGKLGTPAAENNILVNIKTTNGSSDVDTGMFWLSILPSDRVIISATVSSAPPTANDPVVQFRGRASINTNVSFLRDGVLVHTAPVDPAAKFDVTLANQPTGQHVYAITSTDANGRQHASATFALNLAAGSTTVVSGVFLGPTIEVNKTSLKLGETVTVFGKTAPNSMVTLTVNSNPVDYTVTADGNGDWSQLVPSNDVGVGTHTATAMAVSTESTISEESLPVNFTVNPLGACDGKPTADINCDGRVSLTDFSILLFYWLKSNPSNPRADINNDTVVTIVDFSIMLFQWTG